MNDFTRIRKYKSKNGHDRTSKSTLDLIFANVGIQPHVKSSKVTKINAPKNQTIDHHAVACVLDFPSLPKFIFVKTPNDPLRRPEPNAQTTQKIRQPLAQIQVAETDDYDNVMLKLKGVLDELIPTNSPYESTTKKTLAHAYRRHKPTRNRKEAPSGMCIPSEPDRREPYC